MTADRNEILVNFLSAKGGQFQNQKLTGFDGASALDSNTPVLSVLDQKSLLQLNGADTTKFLQGQLTSNVEALSNSQYQNGAACTPKGRMYTSYTLLRADEETFFMAMHEGLTEAARTTLSKYAVFFKCDIQKNQDYLCLGLSGQGIEAEITALFGSLPESGQALAAKGNSWLLKVEGLSPRFELWTPAEQLEQWWNQLVPHFTPATDLHWRRLDCESVTPSLRAEALEKYIPQHLNLPTLGSVSFRKGCYTGQEIVARMQNLGQLKSRCYRLTSDQSLELSADTKLYNGEGKSIGETLDCVPAVNGVEILAVIRVDTAESNDVYLEKDGLKLEAHPLPYTVDTRTELQQ